LSSVILYKNKNRLYQAEYTESINIPLKTQWKTFWIPPNQWKSQWKL